MSDSQLPKQLAARLEEQRKQLRERRDVSPRLRQLARAKVPISALPERARRSPVLTGMLTVAALAFLGACVLGAILVGASGLWLQGQLDDPATTAQNFYGALHQQDYAKAYTYLSSGAQQRMTRSAFIAQYTELDAVAGIVESYTIAGDDVSATTATTTVSVVRRGNVTRAQSQTLSLVKQGGTWRIDAIAVGGSSPVSG